MAGTQGVTRSRELPDNLNPAVEEFYCPCGRFLGFVALIEGTIAIKCKRCKGFAVLDSHQEVVYNEDKGRARSRSSRPEVHQEPPG